MAPYCPAEKSGVREAHVFLQGSPEASFLVVCVSKHIGAFWNTTKQLASGLGYEWPLYKVISEALNIATKQTSVKSGPYSVALIKQTACNTSTLHLPCSYYVQWPPYWPHGCDRSWPANRYFFWNLTGQADHGSPAWIPILVIPSVLL